MTDEKLVEVEKTSDDDLIYKFYEDEKGKLRKVEFHETDFMKNKRIKEPKVLKELEIVTVCRT